MEDFAEMMNLFVMMAFSLGLALAVVTTGFFQHVVYDTLRVHNRCWKLAHELLMIMFRMIEDSGGRLTFCNCYDEKYLNTVIEVAETNKAGASKKKIRSPWGLFTCKGTRFLIILTGLRAPEIGRMSRYAN